MRFLSTKMHGVLDYMTGLLLIASPWIFGFADDGPAMWVPIILGIGAILYSLLTNYELGVIKTLSMPTHLWLDALSGVFLAASPWLFGFSDRVYLPHLLLGIFEIVASLVTQTTPEHQTGTGYLRTDSQGRH
jgi:hypothetical protein